MTPEQLKTLTINAIAQSLGDGYMTQNDGSIAPLDDAKLIEVGKDIDDVVMGVENFTKSLMDQLTKIFIFSDAYKKDLPDLFVDSAEWGGFIETVNFNLADVIDDPMWNLIDGHSYATEEHTFYRPKVVAKIFNERKAVAVPWSIAREQVKTAFKNMGELNNFVSGLQVNVNNTIEVILETYAHMVVSGAIAISDKAINTSIHLVTEYNDETGETETDATKLLMDEKFLAWSSRRIKKARRNITKMTAAFNNGTVPTFTPATQDKLILLGDFADAIKFNLRADTFHDDQLGFGEFKTLAFWQGHYSAGDGETEDESSFTFENISTVSIAADSENKLGIGTKAVEIDNVVGLLYDKRGIGISPFMDKTTSQYTASADFTTYWRHLLMNYIVNSTFNMIALIMD